MTNVYEQSNGPDRPTNNNLAPNYGGSAAPVPGGWSGGQRPPQSSESQMAMALLGQKSAGLAAVLSILIVGAGQMYCGQVGRGIAFFAAYLVSCLLLFVLVGFVLVPIVFIWALVDCIQLANRHNEQLMQRIAGASQWR